MSGSIFHPFVLDNAAGQETVVGIGSDSEKYGVGISSHTHITGIQTVDGFLHAGGGIKDTAGNIGSSGKVLSSTGSGLEWIDPSEGSTANAVNVGTNLDSTNADQFFAFMGTSSGNNPVRVDAGLKYNPSTNVLNSGRIITKGGGNLLKLDGQDSTAPSVNLEIHTHDTAGATAEITLNARDTSNVNRISKIVADADGDNNVNLIFHTDNTERLRISGTGNIIQSGTSNYIRINGGLQDKDGEDGDSGQVLSSTGSQINWVNVGDLSAGSASQVAVSDESTDTTCFPLFATGATGNQSPKSGSNLTFNSSTGQLNATKFVGDGSGLTSITSLGTLTELNVNGTLNVQNGNSLDFGTATNNNIRGQIAATESNDQHLIIATSGGEDIAFRDGGLNGTTNMIIKGDGNVLVNNGSVTATSFSGSGANLTGIFVTGMILLWSGAASAIPSGWVLCDGNNSTPDLRNRFVVGANTSTGDTTYPGLSVGATGGAATDTVNISDSASVVFGANGTGTASKAGSSSATVSISDSDTVNTLPPYYALCYIMKT